MNGVSCGLESRRSTGIEATKGNPKVAREDGAYGKAELGSKIVIVVHKTDVPVGGPGVTGGIGRDLPGQLKGSRRAVGNATLIEGERQICGAAQIDLEPQKAEEK